MSAQEKYIYSMKQRLFGAQLIFFPVQSVSDQQHLASEVRCLHSTTSTTSVLNVEGHLLELWMSLDVTAI